MTGLVSRRSLIGGAFATAFCFGSRLGGETSKANPNLQFADRAVALITSSADNFSETAESFFPGLQSASAIQSVMPLVSIIIPVRGHSIRATSTRWSLHFSDDIYSASLLQYSLPGKQRLYRSGRATASGGVDLIPCGDARLQSPFFSVLSSAYRRHSINPDVWIDNRPHAALFRNLLKSSPQVETALDGCLFSDFKIGGQDHSHLKTFMESTRNGERDELLDVADLAKVSPSTSSLMRILAERATSPRSIAPDRRVYWYEEARRRYARYLYRTLTKGSPEALAHVLKHSRRMRSTHITSLPA